MNLNLSTLFPSRSLLMNSVALTCFSVLVASPQFLRADSPKISKSAFLGDWHLQLKQKENSYPALLSITSLPESKLQGEWVDSQRALSQVEIQRKNKTIQLSLPTSGKNWRCELHLKNGSLSGKLNAGERIYKIQGKKIPNVDTAEGRWAMFYTNNKITTSLLIKKGAEGKLTGNILRNGKTEPLKSFTYSDREIAFTWLQQNGTPYTYNGKLSSTSVLNGSLQTPGKKGSLAMIRVGYEYVGTWDLQLRSKTLKMSQRLKINPDLSGWFGAQPLSDVISTKDTVSFKVQVPFSIIAENPTVQGFMGLQFKGKAQDGKISGELTNKKMKFNLSGKRR